MQKRSFLRAVGAFFLSSALTAPVRSASTRRIAVVYFSKTGHTESVARAVRAMTGAELFRVETINPYPEVYSEATEVVRKEIDNGVIRPLKPLAVDLSRYDAVVLATPTWWHHAAQPLKTWIAAQDWQGRFVITCNTHGGGGLMQTRSDFEALLSKARLGTHLTSFGSVVESSPIVRNWLRENRLIVDSQENNS